jgi:hypothetical protein
MLLIPDSIYDSGNIATGHFASSKAGPLSGGYFFDQEQIPPSSEAQDTETARRLWEISERQCAVRSSARHKQAD